MDTKKLIEEARKIAEEQKEQEVVQQVLEVLAADPAPSTNVTPQQFLDRLVAVVKKVNEVKANGNLKVMSENDTLVDLSTMDGSTSAKSLVTRNRVNEVVQFFTATKVKYYAGQIAIFNTEKVAPSKFADTTLFDKYELPLGAALLGGNTKTLVNGEVISHNHTQSGHYHAAYPGINNANDNLFREFGIQRRSGGARLQGTSDNSNLYANTSTETPTIQATGGAQNKAYGLQIISHIYVAKKDITFAEMGE